MCVTLPRPRSDVWRAAAKEAGWAPGAAALASRGGWTLFPPGRHGRGGRLLPVSARQAGTPRHSGTSAPPFRRSRRPEGARSGAGPPRRRVFPIEKQKKCSILRLGLNTSWSGLQRTHTAFLLQ